MSPDFHRDMADVHEFVDYRLDSEQIFWLMKKAIVERTCVDKGVRLGASHAVKAPPSLCGKYRFADDTLTLIDSGSECTTLQCVHELSAHTACLSKKSCRLERCLELSAANEATGAVTSAGGQNLHCVFRFGPDVQASIKQRKTFANTLQLINVRFFMCVCAPPLADTD